MYLIINRYISIVNPRINVSALENLHNPYYKRIFRTRIQVVVVAVVALVGPAKQLSAIR